MVMIMVIDNRNYDFAIEDVAEIDNKGTNNDAMIMILVTILRTIHWG